MSQHSVVNRHSHRALWHSKLCRLRQKTHWHPIPSPTGYRDQRSGSLSTDPLQVEEQPVRQSVTPGLRQMFPFFSRRFRRDSDFTEHALHYLFGDENLPELVNGPVQVQRFRLFPAPSLLLTLATLVAIKWIRLRLRS